MYICLTVLVILDIGAVEVLKFQQMLVNIGAHFQAVAYFNLPLRSPSELPRRDVKRVFAECSGASTSGDGSLLATPHEIRMVLEKVRTHVSFELSDEQMEAEFLKIRDKTFDIDAFHSWYRAVVKQCAVPQLKGLWNQILAFLTL